MKCLSHKKAYLNVTNRTPNMRNVVRGTRTWYLCTPCVLLTTRIHRTYHNPLCTSTHIR